MTENKKTAEDLVEDLFDEEEEEDSDALTLNDLSTGYIGNPKIGESVEFVISKITKMTGDQLIGKTREGKTFKKNLSSVDYGYEIITEDGSKYTISSWEVFGKMKSILQKLQVIKGSKIKIEHLCDGMKPENKEKDKYNVFGFVDGSFKTLDRDTKEWNVE